MSGLELLERCIGRGLEFRLVGPSCLAITGPESVLRSLDPDLCEHGPDLIALAQEFSEDSGMRRPAVL
jgi:hypothetical protein